MTIAIIDYGAGNTTSVCNALLQIGATGVVTRDPVAIKSADRVIFPGVGEARSAMDKLSEYGLDRIIPALEQPVLGICLGLQLLCTHSEERNTHCLGVFHTQVRRFPPIDLVPHMGWNSITNLADPLFAGIREGEDMYFVHGYYAEPCEQAIASCSYIVPFAPALRRENFMAVQFHPEKSGDAGLQILRNFIEHAGTKSPSSNYP